MGKRTVLKINFRISHSCIGYHILYHGECDVSINYSSVTDIAIFNQTLFLKILKKKTCLYIIGKPCRL